MTTAILVHSLTGTTCAFAEEIATALRAGGHEVRLTRLETDRPVKSGTPDNHAPFSVVNVPDISDCELVLLGAPVWGFDTTPVAAETVAALGSLRGKRVLPFATAHFGGGQRAVKRLGARAGLAGARVLPGTAVPLLFRDRDKEFRRGAQQVARAVGA